MTLATGTQANCAPGSGGTYSAQVLADYRYDYLDRLTAFRSFVTNGSTATKDDAADYEYDALDRVVAQTESHGAAGAPRTTLLSYLGLGGQVSREEQRNGDDATDPLLTTKSYAYDAYANRIGLTTSPAGGTPASYTYGYDVHGSVSLLLADTGAATASYGYRAYGGADDELTAGDFDPSDRTEATGLLDNPLNAFRYSAKRFDSGSGSIDMGARRFGPDTARFLQRDVFNGALADLGLALDPLTQNRYALAGGNPISFVEWDGHVVDADGGGGSSLAPNPQTSDGDGSLTVVQKVGLGLGAALDAGEAAFGTLADNILQAGRRYATRVRSLAERGAQSFWWRLPIAEDIRKASLGARASLAEAGAGLQSAPTRLLGRSLGVLSFGLGLALGYGTQRANDAARTDLTETDRDIRAAFRGVTEAGFAAALAGAAATACAPSLVFAAVCGAAGGFVGSGVGSLAADVGLAAADWAGDALSDVKLPDISLPSLELPDLAWW